MAKGTKLQVVTSVCTKKNSKSGKDEPLHIAVPTLDAELFATDQAKAIAEFIAACKAMRAAGNRVSGKLGKQEVVDKEMPLGPLGNVDRDYALTDFIAHWRRGYELYIAAHGLQDLARERFGKPEVREEKKGRAEKVVDVSKLG